MYVAAEQNIGELPTWLGVMAGSIQRHKAKWPSVTYAVPTATRFGIGRLNVQRGTLQQLEETYMIAMLLLQIAIPQPAKAGSLWQAMAECSGVAVQPGGDLSDVKWRIDSARTHDRHGGHAEWVAT